MKWTHLNVLGAVFWQLDTQTARSDKIQLFVVPEEWWVQGLGEAMGNWCSAGTEFQQSYTVEQKQHILSFETEATLYTREQKGEVVEGGLKEMTLPCPSIPITWNSILTLFSKRCRKFSWGGQAHRTSNNFSSRVVCLFPKKLLALRRAQTLCLDVGPGVWGFQRFLPGMGMHSLKRDDPGCHSELLPPMETGSQGLLKSTEVKKELFAMLDC